MNGSPKRMWGTPLDLNKGGISYILVRICHIVITSGQRSPKGYEKFTKNTAQKWQGKDVNPSFSDSKLYILPIIHVHIFI